MSIVYLITNNINGRKYIGADKNNNPKYLGSGVLIKNAIKKYGRCNFKKTIIEECDEFHLYEREKFWIEFFDAVVSDIYYNLTEGGKGGNKLNNSESYKKWDKNKFDIAELNEKRKGMSYDEIYGMKGEFEREKRKLGQTGKQYTNESKMKMSESAKGHIPWNRGLTIDDERVKRNIINRKCVSCIKEYTLITPNNEKHIFQGKKQLREFIKNENKNLRHGTKINVDFLISNGNTNNYIIIINKIKK